MLRGTKRPLLILEWLDPGWRAALCRQSGGGWTLKELGTDKSRNLRRLPKALLLAGADAGAARLRIWMESEPRLMQMEVPQDAEEEEFHTLLQGEARTEMGEEVHRMRLATVLADRFELGTEPDALLVSSFELNQLEAWQSDAEAQGLRFEGVSSIETAVLAACPPGKPLLFIRGRSAWAVLPADERGPAMLLTLPLGTVPASDPERENKAAERLQKRGLDGLFVCLPGDCSAEREASLRRLLDQSPETPWVCWPDLRTDAAAALATARPGRVEDAPPVISVPPRARDPHRVGTWILGFILLLTLTWLGLHTRGLKLDLEHAKGRETAWRTLEQEQKRVSDQVSRLRSQQNEVMALKSKVERPTPLPALLLPLLDTLATAMPQYSRLEEIRVQEDGSLRLVGLTQWQDGLLSLDQALRELCDPLGFRREFEGLTALEDSTVQQFSFRLYRMEGAR